MISDMYNSNERFNVIEAGRRTGKTTFALNLVRNMAIEKDRRNILVVWPNRAHIHIYAQELGKFNRVSSFSDFDNGSRIYFKTEDDLKSGHGMNFDFIALDDCQKSDTWNRVRPLVADARGGILVIGTDVWHSVLKYLSKVT